MSASASNRVPTSTSNTTTLPSSLTKYYNASQAIPAFSVIVKPTFTKYLEETRKKLTKRIPQDKYDDLMSWLADPNRKARSQAERNAKSKAKRRWYIREDVHQELRGLWRRPTTTEQALKVVPEPEIYDVIVRKHSNVEHSGQKKTYRTLKLYTTSIGDGK